MEVTDDVEHHEDFIWLTLGGLYAVLRLNVVKMDALTVPSAYSCRPAKPPTATGLRRAAPVDEPERRRCAVVVARGRKLPHAAQGGLRADHSSGALRAAAGWARTSVEIHDSTGRYFSIIGVEVRATNRQVCHWCQPLLAPRGQRLLHSWPAASTMCSTCWPAPTCGGAVAT